MSLHSAVHTHTHTTDWESLNQGHRDFKRLYNTNHHHRHTRADGPGLTCHTDPIYCTRIRRDVPTTAVVSPPVVTWPRFKIIGNRYGSFQEI